MFGDGVGSDTIYLYHFFSDSCKFFYFDIPGSKTFEFAIKRFMSRKINVEVLTDYNNIPFDFFDIVICLEVLEHLPDPISLIKKIYSVLKKDGIVLLTESFNGVTPNFPTHLESNIKYAFRTPFLFLKNKLYLTYYPYTWPKGRPMEFQKKRRIKFREKVILYTQKELIFPMIAEKLKTKFKKIIGI